MMRARLVAEAIWRSRWFGWVMIGIFLLWYAWWWCHIPSPAKAATVLAVIASIMAYRVEPGDFEKLAWTVVLFAFLFMELRAIDYREDQEKIAHDAEVLRQAQEFSAIGTSIQTGVQGILKQSHDEFAQTVQGESKHFDATMQKAQEGIDQITGGKSYIIVDTVPNPKNPEDSKLALLISLCPKCADDVTSRIYVWQANPVSESEHDPPIYEGAVDANMRYAKDKITPSTVGVTTYIVHAIARNRPTTEVLEVRFNWKKREWESSWIIAREIKAPHYDPKTHVVEGLRSKVLAKRGWHTVPVAYPDPKTTKTIP